MFLMLGLSQFETVQGNRTAQKITHKPKGAWSIKPSPSGRFGLVNEVWGYVLPGLTIAEAQRASELLGDASRWRDHGSAFEAIEASWEFIGGAS